MDKDNSKVQSSFNEGAGLKKPDNRKYKERTAPDPNAKHRNNPCPSGHYRNKEGKCVQKGVGKDYKP
jgi:hypothetical protein